MFGSIPAKAQLETGPYYRPDALHDKVEADGS